MNNQAAITMLKGFEQSLDDYCELNEEGKAAFRMAITALELFGNSEQLPSAQPEHKKMSNKEWVDFLSEQFAVSRTSAREMLHGLMRCKAEDNFKKQYSGGRNEKG